MDLGNGLCIEGKNKKGGKRDSKISRPTNNRNGGIINLKEIQNENMVLGKSSALVCSTFPKYLPDIGHCLK